MDLDAAFTGSAGEEDRDRLGTIDSDLNRDAKASSRKVSFLENGTVVGWLIIVVMVVFLVFHFVTVVSGKP